MIFFGECKTLFRRRPERPGRKHWYKSRLITLCSVRLAVPAFIVLFKETNIWLISVDYNRERNGVIL